MSHELPLSGREKHACARQAQRFLAQLLQQFRFAKADFPQVLVKRIS
jgi:hypothetical protein